MTSERVSTVDLHTIPDRTHAVLRNYIASRRADVDAIGAPVGEALDQLEHFVLGPGKRIRPLYAWAGYAAGVAHTGSDATALVEEAISALSSLEFIQACALIHDDIIDASDTRRGRPATHKAIAATHAEHGYRGDSDAFGESIAILVGDLALAWADDMLLDSGLDDCALRRARIPWRAMRSEVIGGQILDITLESSASEDRRLARSVNRYKTAAYTIERPLHLGAALAGAPAGLIESLRAYGRDIGVAYQLRDDLLGVFGDPSVTGKPAGDDIREGKRTELLSAALEHADDTDPAAAAEIRAAVGHTSDPDTIARVATLIDATGAPALMEKEIRALTESGLGHLRDTDIPRHIADMLEHLAIKSTQRTY